MIVGQSPLQKQKFSQIVSENKNKSKFNYVLSIMEKT